MVGSESPTQNQIQNTNPCQLHANAKSLKAQWLHYVPPGSTHKNSMFCPRSVFMCFVQISEQTVIISLYSIN